MKDIKLFTPEKYQTAAYTKLEDGIYQHDDLFVTSLSFLQEPEYGENTYADDISQYPLEDVLDQFDVYVSDPYETCNTGESTRCYLEFASDEKDCVEQLLSIIGKHVYNQSKEKEGKVFEILVIE